MSDRTKHGPPAPGEESAGPALSIMIEQTKRTADAIELLTKRAWVEMAVRTITVRGVGQTDGSGDLAIELYEVPQGYVGHLTLLAIDQAGVTPAAPVTSANLWVAIYGSEQSGATTQAQVVQVGSMLDMLPDSPVADGQIPCSFRYGDKDSAPTLRGPSVFYLVVDSATAARQLFARGNVVIERIE